MKRNLVKYVCMAAISGVAMDAFAQSQFTLIAVNIGPTGSSGQTLNYGYDTNAIGGEWVKILCTGLGQWFEFTTPSIAAHISWISLTGQIGPAPSII